MKQFLIGMMVLVSLAGCAARNLKAPCPNFGINCQKVPINSWNYNEG